MKNLAINIIWIAIGFVLTTLVLTRCAEARQSFTGFEQDGPVYWPGQTQAEWYAQFPQGCHQPWQVMPSSLVNGGQVGHFAEVVTGWLENGTCICIDRKASSAAVFAFELTRVGRLAISPDAKIGFHSDRDVREWFAQVFGWYPGLLEVYASTPAASNGMVYIPGGWFNARGVPTCEVR